MFEREAARFFPDLGGVTYMNTASVAPGCRPAVDALKAAADAWAQGRFDWPAAERAGEEVRARFGQLVHAAPDTIALVPAASAVAGLVAEHVARRFSGGNIVVGEAEFSSNLYPWRQLATRGFEVRMLPHPGGALPEADVEAAVDRDTRLVAVSAVQSATGYRADLARLRDVSRDALLYVDAAQAVGAVPIDMQALRIDALAAPSHKFLIGTRGMGYAAFAPGLRDALEPLWPGWKAAAEPSASFYGPDMVLSRTASRLDMSLAWINALAEQQSMGVLADLGFDRVHAHDAALADLLRGGLRDAGIPFLDFGEHHGSAIVACMPEDERAPERLAEAGVIVAARAGRIRLSLHLHNTAHEVERVVTLLRAP